MITRVRYEFIIRAKQPVCHIAESFGNTALIAQRKARLPGGEFARIPYVSADAMRHGLREAAAYVVLGAAGIEGQLREAALRLLFNGGMIVSREDAKEPAADGEEPKAKGKREKKPLKSLEPGDPSTIKLDAYAELVDIYPPLGLLGGCAMNRTIPGRLNVDDLMLICTETVHKLPQWAVDWLGAHNELPAPAREHVEEVQRVRMDPMLSPAMRALLSEGERDRVERRMLAHEGASAKADAVAVADTKSTMMPRRHETIVSGSLFLWAIEATCVTQIDRDTLDTMALAFLKRCRVGGKGSVGHGEVECLAGWWTDLTPSRTEDDPGAVLDVEQEPPKGEGLVLHQTHVDRFRAHVRERADKIRLFVENVVA